MLKLQAFKSGQVCVVLFMLMLVAACSEDSVPGLPEENMPISPFALALVDNPAAPVLRSGIVGTPPFIADPGVIKDASGYHLFMTNQFCDLNNNAQWDEGEHLFDADNTLLCVADRGVAATMYAFSDDEGLSWTVRPQPAVEPGPFGWDNVNLETPFAFVHDDTLYVLYCAFGDKDGSLFMTRYQIGFASVALNGRTIKQALMDDAVVLGKNNGGAEPLLAGNILTSDYDNNTQEPSVVVTESGFELFFTGLRLSDPALDLTPGNGNDITGIALMRQKFDFDWQKTGEMEVAHDITNAAPETDEALALSPVNIGEVHYYSGKYYYFYTTLEAGADFHYGERIARAVSDDGLTWTDMEVVLQPGEVESDYKGWGIMAPSVVFENDRLVLFYTAWGDTSTTPCVMSGAGARWGQQVTGGQKCVFGNLVRAVTVPAGS